MAGEKDYSVGSDGLEYNLTLHESVTWHDGSPFSAEDVKFTFEYFLKYPKSRFTKPLKKIKKVFYNYRII